MIKLVFEEDKQVAIPEMMKVLNDWQRSTSETGNNFFVSQTCFKDYQLAELRLNDPRSFHFDLTSKQDCMVYLLEGSLKLNSTLILAHQHYVYVGNNNSIHIQTAQAVSLLIIQFNNPLPEHTPILLRPTLIKISHQSLIRQLIDLNIKNELELIYLEAKILELIYLHFNNLIELEDEGSVNKDLEKMEHAKTIIMENMRNPCSLIELAHEVGLNDFKLKKGFKEYYGTTVFGYLHDLRMEKAKILLCKDKKIIAVADEVGYKNAHHFSAAFKKYFGVLPSKLKGKMA
ncbi:MAG: AraC family transcriptional regulator [Pelobium sp.]